MDAALYSFTEVATHAQGLGWKYEKYTSRSKTLTVTKDGKHVTVKFGPTGSVARVVADGQPYEPNLASAKIALGEAA